jgi:uncharacterized protein
VQVLSADPKTQRIALSMKALQEPQPQRAEKPKPKPKPELSLDQKLSALSDRWKAR